MTRILHILDHSLPLHSGYCFRTRAIMKAQIGLGHDVAGITGVRHQRGGASADNPSEVIDGLSFYRTAGEVAGPALLREWREISLLSDRICEVVEEWRPDILHAHSPALNGMAALQAARRMGLPLVYEIRAFWEDAAVGNGTGRADSPKYWLTRQLENRVVQGADAVAVICEGLRGDLIKRGFPAGKIFVSPNGVDLSLFGEPVAPEPALAQEIGLNNGPVLGFIGSFYDYEGIDDLIAAMPGICAAQPGAQLLLVGGGPMAESLKAAAKNSPVADSIHMIGRVPHDQVERYYALVDILVYPRKSMRLTELVTPLKPLEAMAQGKLVAASDVGGHRELISDGETGTLFAADDPNALASAIDKMLANRDNWPKIVDVARDFVKNDRNWSSNISRYEPVYQGLIDQMSVGRAA